MARPRVVVVRRGGGLPLLLVLVGLGVAGYFAWKRWGLPASAGGVPERPNSSAPVDDAALGESGAPDEIEARVAALADYQGTVLHMMGPDRNERFVSEWEDAVGVAKGHLRDLRRSIDRVEPGAERSARLALSKDLRELAAVMGRHRATKPR